MRRPAGGPFADRRHVRIGQLCLCLASIWSLASCTTPRPKIRIDTPLGKITAVVFDDKAPLTTAQFLKNVTAGVFDNGRASFYRVVRIDNQPVNPVKIEVIQGGVDKESGDLATPFIRHETTAETGLRHLDGTLSMAREGPGTANTEFFICVGPQPELDFGGKRNPDGQGFAAFGQIVSGMDVVRRIQNLPDEKQYLKDEVPILKIVRIK